MEINISPVNFAIRLKELRENRNLTQAELAEQLGVGVSTIGMWESTQRTPTAKMLLKLISFFGCTLDYLLGYSNSFTPNTQPTPYVLSNREEELLSMFRQMNTAQQNRFLGIAEGMIEEATKFKKQ